MNTCDCTTCKEKRERERAFREKEKLTELAKELSKIIKGFEKHLILNEGQELMLEHLKQWLEKTEVALGLIGVLEKLYGLNEESNF